MNNNGSISENKRKVLKGKGFIVFNDTEKTVATAITETSVYVAFFATKKDAKKFVSISKRFNKSHKYTIKEANLRIK